uniref:Uncharacterized protein n=1 Tax=Marseillevirus LCMAC103 TaxID=2506604 RepID=A0A481YWT7_9VIRU|nr:MAG: hypothetical protein LCMAC103_03780 [Marseillevirus LCMAC103]
MGDKAFRAYAHSEVKRLYSNHDAAAARFMARLRTSDEVAESVIGMANDRFGLAHDGVYKGWLSVTINRNCYNTVVHSTQDDAMMVIKAGKTEWGWSISHYSTPGIWRGAQLAAGAIQRRWRTRKARRVGRAELYAPGGRGALEAKRHFGAGHDW